MTFPATGKTPITPRHYTLEGRKVVPCDVMTWAKWFETNKKHIKLDQIIKRRWFGMFGTQEVSVSTVFLGLDHNFGMGDAPLIFETMIFGGRHDGYQQRYSTYEQAEYGHDLAVRKVKGAIL